MTTFSEGRFPGQRDRYAPPPPSTPAVYDVFVLPRFRNSHEPYFIYEASSLAEVAEMVLAGEIPAEGYGIEIAPRHGRRASEFEHAAARRIFAGLEGFTSGGMSQHASARSYREPLVRGGERVLAYKRGAA